MGIYVYEHLCDGIGPEPTIAATGPYGRIAYPARPLTVAALPSAVRRLLRPIRLARADFAKRSHVQPCEQIVCDSPYPKYLLTDFKIYRDA